MKFKAHIALITVAIATLGVAFVMGVNAQSKGPVYAVIDISETMDPEAYIKAVSAVEPKATLSAGGRFVVRTTKAMALDGGPPPNRLVIIAFDSEEQARAWHASQPIKDIDAVRAKTTKSRAFLVEALPN